MPSRATSPRSSPRGPCPEDPRPPSPDDSRRRQRQAWDRLALSLEDFYPAASTQYYRRCEIALLERHLAPFADKRVLKLDLWNEAFNTRILHWMAGEGGRTFGLDVSPAVAARARRNGREHGDGARLSSADIRELPYAPGTFDLAYTMGTIEHIPEYGAALRELHRVLRPGGRAVVGVPHRWNLFLRPLLVWALTRLGRYPYAPERSFSAGELRRELEAAGFRVVNRSGILALPGALRILDVYLYTRGNALHRLSRFWLAPFALAETRWRWPGRFGYLLAMVVEKPAG